MLDIINTKKCFSGFFSIMDSPVLLSWTKFTNCTDIHWALLMWQHCFKHFKQLTNWNLTQCYKIGTVIFIFFRLGNRSERLNNQKLFLLELIHEPKQSGSISTCIISYT